MTSDQIDVNRVLSFRMRDTLRGYTGTGLVFAMLGTFVLIMPDADQQDWEGMLAGAVVLVLGVAMLIVPKLKLKRNEQLVAEISPAGVMMVIQNSRRQRFFIPWDEVIEITQISFIRRVVTTFATYVREPAIAVSLDFFAREIDVEEDGRGLFWHHHVHIRPDGTGVRLALMHHEFNMSRRKLRAELEGRWRAFSAHPDAKKPANAERDPLALTEQLWDFTTATAGRSLALKGIAILATLPAIYFWHYAFTFVGIANLNIAQIESYAGSLLKEGKLPGRINGGPITMLMPDLAKSIQSGLCERSIKLDPAKSGVLPRYTQHHACRASFGTTDRRLAEAVFDVVVAEYKQTTGVNTTTGVETTRVYGALTAVAPPANEVRVRLCSDGGC